MNTLLIVVGLVVIAVIALMFLRRSFVVSYSKEIEADKDAVWQQIVDFRNWKAWSPWLAHEPDAKLEYSDNSSSTGSWYSWDGQCIGAGRMTHVSIGDNEIEEKLEFTRPSFSPCPVKWKVEALDDGRRVRLSWTMHGSIPLLFGFIVGRMKAQITRDFEWGLGLLARLVNPQTEAAQLSFSYPKTVAAHHYLGIKHRCATDDIGSWMEKNMPRLFEFLSSNNIESSGAPLTIWTKRHFGGKEFSFIMAAPIGEQDAENIKSKAESAGMLVDHHDGGEAYMETLLLGDYRFLSMAWMVAFDHLKMARKKFDWRRHPIEIYLNDPREVQNSNEIRTQILIPTRL